MRTIRSLSARCLGSASPVLALLAAVALGAPVRLQAETLDMPVHERTLANGLVVIVHEDHTLPVVAVNVLYRVGSRDEAERHTGFAHLFEHLMFMGTTRAPSKMFDAWIESAGGESNAWTAEDFTDYHESGPPGLLPLFLWLEADRLQTLGREIDRAKLDLQRDVVRNERRQSIENVPYGKVELRLPELMFPEGHPYHHPVIGSHEDLEAASVDDVRAFFAAHYLPANASLVIAGDVTTDQAFALAERSFAWLPTAPAPTRDAPAPAPRLSGVVRETMPDQVELTKVVMAFHSSARFGPGDADLDLLAAILATGKSSRLYRALVLDQRLAQSVDASQSSQSLCSMFTLEVVLRSGVAVEAAETAIDAVLAEMAVDGPSQEELERARNVFESHFVDRLQSLAERAMTLNLYHAECGQADFAARDLARYRAATTASVREWALRTLDLKSRVILRVVPAAPPKADDAPAAAPEPAHEEGR